jgi:hypothetical protein
LDDRVFCARIIARNALTCKPSRGILSSYGVPSCYFEEIEPRTLGLADG